MQQQNRALRKAGAVVKAVDAVDVFPVKELAALSAPRAGLLRVLEEEEEVFAEAFSLAGGRQRRHDGHVPVVPAAVEGSPVRAGDRVHVGPEGQTLRRGLLPVGGVKPFAAVDDLKIALFLQKGDQRFFRLRLTAGELRYGMELFLQGERGFQCAVHHGSSSFRTAAICFSTDPTEVPPSLTRLETQWSRSMWI